MRALSSVPYNTLLGEPRLVLPNERSTAFFAEKLFPNDHGISEVYRSFSREYTVDLTSLPTMRKAFIRGFGEFYAVGRNGSTQRSLMRIRAAQYCPPGQELGIPVRLSKFGKRGAHCTWLHRLGTDRQTISARILPPLQIEGLHRRYAEGISFVELLWMFHEWNPQAQFWLPMDLRVELWQFMSDPCKRGANAAWPPAPHKYYSVDPVYQQYCENHYFGHGDAMSSDAHLRLWDKSGRKIVCRAPELRLASRDFDDDGIEYSIRDVDASVLVGGAEGPEASSGGSVTEPAELYWPLYNAPPVVDFETRSLIKP